MLSRTAGAPSPSGPFTTARALALGASALDSTPAWLYAWSTEPLNQLPRVLGLGVSALVALLYLGHQVWPVCPQSSFTGWN